MSRDIQARIRGWQWFLMRRRLLLVLRDSPAVPLVFLIVAVALPLLSVQGARRMAQVVGTLEQLSATVTIDRYLALFLFWQTVLLVVGLLYLSKAQRRPMSYRFLPFSYTTYLGTCVRRAVAAALVAALTVYAPLYWYIEQGLRRSFSLLDALLLSVSVLIVAVVAAGAYIWLLRLMALRARWSAIGLWIIVLLAAVASMHGVLLDAWGAALRQAKGTDVGLAVGILVALGTGLRTLMHRQPEHAISPAATMRSARKKRRFTAFYGWIDLTKRTIPVMLNLRQIDIFVVSVCIGLVVLGLGFVMRLAAPSGAAVAQTVVVDILPYAVALYTLSARSNFFGARGDGLRYLPLDMPGYAKYLLLLSASWQVVATLGLVVAVTAVSGISLDVAGLLDFAYVATVIACLAYGIGVAFYDNAIGSRIAGVALFTGTSFIAQTILQELSVYEYGLEAAAMTMVVGTALAVTAIEKARRSVYAGT